MLYGSGIYIVSKDNVAQFIEEVTQQYKDIDWFLPEEYIYRYFDKRDTHKLVFLGNEVHSKSYNKHKVTQISWQNPKPYDEALNSAKHMAKNGCRYSNNCWWVYRKFSEIESLYNILISSYDKEFAFEAFLDKLKEIGAEILSATELKNKFITCKPYEEIKIYIKADKNKETAKENKEIESKSYEVVHDGRPLYFDENIESDEDIFDKLFT